MYHPSEYAENWHSLEEYQGVVSQLFGGREPRYNASDVGVLGRGAASLLLSRSRRGGEASLAEKEYHVDFRSLLNEEVRRVCLPRSVFICLA